MTELQRTPTISRDAYEHLRYQILDACSSGKKSRVNAEAQLEFIKRYYPAAQEGDE